MWGGGEDVAYTRTTDLFMTERKEIRGRIVCVEGEGEDVAYTRTTDLFMTERKEIRGRIVIVCVCVWGGGRCGLHKDDRFIHDREKRNKREDCVCVWGGRKMWLTQGRQIYS